jgi:hypothetical protein
MIIDDEIWCQKMMQKVSFINDENGGWKIDKNRPKIDPYKIHQKVV